MLKATSDELRSCYRQLLLTLDTKLTANENVDAETDELAIICKALEARGYRVNADASDWVLALSATTWKLQDDT